MTAGTITKIELTNGDGFPRRYTCASGVAIAKNIILKLSDPRTASSGAVVGDDCAGISSMEKDGTDFSTTITAWTKGIFKGSASGAILIGNPLQIETSNYLKVAAAGTSGAAIVGYSLEAADDGHTFQFVLDI